MEWNDKIETIMRVCKLKQKELAEIISVSQGYLSDILNSRSKNPTFSFMYNLVEKLKISPDWLLTGEGSMFKNQEIYLQKDQRIIIADTNIESDVVLIYGGTNKASAGTGQELLNNSSEKAIPMLEKFILPFKGREAGWVEVVGDSMVNEKLFDGDIVIYIKGLIRNDGIYVIQYANEVMVKRLEFDPIDKKIYIKSANEKYAYRDKIVNANDENLVILGKVKAWAHQHPY